MSCVKRCGKLQSLTLAVLFCMWGNAVAEEPVSSDAKVTALRYRSVYVPHTELDQFTRGYLPMKRDEFAKLAEDHARQKPRPLKNITSIRSAEYHAFFREGQLTAGAATLDVAHTGDEPARLLLSPCQLALGPATWHGSGSGNDAILGNDSAGNLEALVRESGRMTFSWTLRSRTRLGNETVFDVVLAPAPMNRLTVDLPPGYQLLSDHGIVSQSRDTSADAVASPHNTRRWVLQLGGAYRFRLTVASDDVVRQRRQSVRLQQDTLYRLTDDGLEVECELELQASQKTVELLQFRVDPQLQVTAVRLGNRDIPWTLVGQSGGQSRQLQIRLDETLPEIPGTLRITALGSLRTGQIWRLPRFHALNMVWRQGTMAVTVPESLSLRHLKAHCARQSAVTTQDTVSGATTRHFELFSDDGYLEVSVARSVPTATGIVGTTINLDPGGVAVQIVAELSCVAGHQYLLTADVPNVWTLDGIEAEPASALEDHQFVAYDAGHKKLQIRLAEPVSADRPLRLAIRAHRTPTPLLQADDFRPIRFHDLHSDTRLVAIAPHSSFRLSVTGDAGVRRRDPESLPTELSDLLRPTSGGIVFEDDQRADSMTVNVTREDPNFSAENHVLAEVSPAWLTESYQLICSPSETSLDRLLVLVTVPRAEPIDWSLDGDATQLLGVRRLPELKGRPVRYSQRGEVWELTLRNPQDEPFEIRGTRRTPFSSRMPISLVTLPDAASQDGWLTIRSLGAANISIQASSVKSIPTDPPLPQELFPAPGKISLRRVT